MEADTESVGMLLDDGKLSEISTDSVGAPPSRWKEDFHRLVFLEID